MLTILAALQFAESGSEIRVRVSGVGDLALVRLVNSYGRSALASRP